MQTGSKRLTLAPIRTRRGGSIGAEVRLGKTDLLLPDFHSVIDHFDLHCRQCCGSGLAHQKRGDPAMQAP